MIPNIVSALRVVFAPAFAWCFSQGETKWLVVALCLTGVAVFSDWLDGHLARKMRATSDFGKIFDPMADAIFFVVVFGTFAAAEIIPWWLASVFIVRESLQHLVVRPLAKRRGVVMAAKYIGKVKTTVQCVVALLVVGLEIVRLQGDTLIRDYDTFTLFNTFDAVSFTAVGIAAFLSAYSILPYIVALMRLPKADEEVKA